MNILGNYDQLLQRPTKANLRTQTTIHVWSVEKRKWLSQEPKLTLLNSFDGKEFQRLNWVDDLDGGWYDYQGEQSILLFNE